MIVCLYGITALALTSASAPIVLDILAPRNESRPRTVAYQTEYFFDQDKYFGLTLIHAILAVPATQTSVIFHDHLFATFINHTRGMIEILKCHLESIHEEASSEDTRGIMERIKLCADLQTNILQFIDTLESSYTMALLLILGLNMLVITVTGMTAVIQVHETRQLIRYAGFTLGTIVHLFWSSFQGHKLIVDSESVFTSAYQSEWYNLPCKFQRMLLPIMMRSMTPCQITAGKLYVMSMNSFGTAMKTTMSFFTLLLSFR